MSLLLTHRCHYYQLLPNSFMGHGQCSNGIFPALQMHSAPVRSYTWDLLPMHPGLTTQSLTSRLTFLLLHTLMLELSIIRCQRHV